MNQDLNLDPQDGAPADSFDNNYAQLSDVDEFVARTEDYAAGRTSPEAYRAYRLTRGVYGQRQPDAYMLRVKMPGGIVLPDQLRAVADVVDVAPERVAHITTRENIQIHHFPLPEVEKWMRHLAEVGLTMTEACGNAVRNVTQDPFAGLAADEPFDTTPYLQAIVHFFLRNPRAQGLPRKFKIAISTSAEDRAYAAIHDLGLIATTTDEGAPAFAVLVGGGLASMPRSGLLVHPAWPAEQVLTPMLAVIDFFQEHGNRKLRSKARIKHVLRKMGDEAFAATYQDYLSKVLADPPPAIEVPPVLHKPLEHWEFHPESLSQPVAHWARSAVQETRLPGKVFVTVRLDQGGAVSSSNLRHLADLAARYGEGRLQFTPQQNAVLRAVPVSQLASLHRDLQAADLAKPGAGSPADVTSCPGASTCALAITFSRSLTDELVRLVEGRTDRDLSIKISGCHNSCGQHHIGTIGLYGALRRIDGRPAPHYRLLVGGQVGPQGAIFGKDLGLVPARRVPEALRRVLELADGHLSEGRTAGDWLRTAPVDELRPHLRDLLELGDGSGNELDYWDIGATAPFLGEAVGVGECAA